jgi:hypothetical protein
MSAYSFSVTVPPEPVMFILVLSLGGIALAVFGFRLVFRRFVGYWEAAGRTFNFSKLDKTKRSMLMIDSLGLCLLGLSIVYLTVVPCVFAGFFRH